MKQPQIQSTFDQELAAQGKMRAYKTEFVRNANGNTAVIYRQVIVKIPKADVVSSVQPSIKKSARKGTNLDKVVDFFKTTDIKDKKALVLQISEMLNVTQSNAAVYLYKASKLV